MYELPLVALITRRIGGKWECSQIHEWEHTKCLVSMPKSLPLQENTGSPEVMLEHNFYEVFSSYQLFPRATNTASRKEQLYAADKS